MKKTSDFQQGTEKIFVLGAGYSLGEHENLPELLKSYTVIACNSAISIFNDGDKLDYYLITDQLVTKGNFFQKKHIAKNIILANDAMYNDEKDNMYCVRRRYDNRTYDFSVSDTDGKLICGMDCVHVAANFAYCLGAKIIYLLGVDLRWNGDKKYCVKNENDLLVNGNMDCYKHDKENKKNDSDPSLEMSYGGWKNIIRQNMDINFINCSKTGRLKDIIPTMDLKDVI